MLKETAVHKKWEERREEGDGDRENSAAAAGKAEAQIQKASARGANVYDCNTQYCGVRHVS
jgi:hypothetical protein